MDLSLVDDGALKKNILEMFSEHKNLWSELLGTNWATHHTIDLNVEPCPIRQQSYRAKQRSRKGLRKIMEKPLEVCVVEPVQAESASHSFLVFEKNGTFQFCV